MAGGDKELINIALIQMTSSKVLDQNLEFIETHVRDAAAAGATYVLTPENSLIMDLDGRSVARVAASDDYKACFQSLSDLARDLHVWLHIGSTPVYLGKDKSEESRQAFLANRSILIGPNGQEVDFYDKIHMFDVSLPDGETYRESRHYRPGTRAVVVDCGFARIGMSVCYDLRFAPLYRQLAQAGAEMITVPAAFTQITGAAHWHVLLRARAIETGCFILASAQTGLHDTGRGTFGHSLIVAPWGEILLDAGVDVGAFLTPLDLSLIGEAREKIPALQHDRPFNMDTPL